MILMNDNEERRNLQRFGTIRLNETEAKEVIAEELAYGDHNVVSPRAKSDRKFRISANI